MERLADVQQTVVELYQQYQQELDLNGPDLNLENVESIERALESIYARDAIATRNHTRFPRALTQKLRSAFADLLLLMDGKDIKQMKPSKSAEIDEEEE
ncbi:hypothetical protein QWY77_02480 [Thalassotalea ponticola]|uniref:hypothetical protein n=1 Tax=Thalassotalea ponticola TaxID=1523392 RepID=UPI0025B33519|nr:hypothetical protein [Thalassotalea ponticola]MDN3651630.1 hypothetical protein [Thalassotalea ponticola]